jgi:tetratricopeptide (TPR) repeat protein
MAQEGEMTARRRENLFLPAAAILLAAMAFAVPARAESITLPPEAAQAMDAIYGGDPDAGVAIARRIQQAQPDQPLGFVLEAEAKWWKRECGAYEIKYGMADAWQRSKEPEDKAYLLLADKAIELAEAQLAKSDSAEMHVYAGLGWALKARVYALRGENRNVARAGVKGRAEMLRALELDPEMADATAVLGVYNYYVDTLGPMVKLLRFFMGIPGGNKETGVKQMETGMSEGVLMKVDARFVLAMLLRQYGQKYEQALTIAEPLHEKYPRNAIFTLLLGNLNLELGRDSKASEYFHAVLELPNPDAECRDRVREIANSFLKSLP